MVPVTESRREDAKDMIPAGLGGYASEYVLIS